MDKKIVYRGTTYDLELAKDIEALFDLIGDNQKREAINDQTSLCDVLLQAAIR